MTPNYGYMYCALWFVTLCCLELIYPSHHENLISLQSTSSTSCNHAKSSHVETVRYLSTKTYLQV
jgi:hypothetical protein